jgi:hypothetical protein
MSSKREEQGTAGERLEIGHRDDLKEAAVAPQRRTTHHCKLEFVLYLGQKVLCFEPDCSDNNNEEHEEHESRH